MPRYSDWKDKDKCGHCDRAYTARRVKWWICLDINCSKDSVKMAMCSECIVKHKFVEKYYSQCHCSKKILAESGELSVEELNSKDFWLHCHKDSFKEEWQLKGEELLR